MRNGIHHRVLLVLAAFFIIGFLPLTPLKGAGTVKSSDHEVLIFDYHRFNTFRSDSMTVRLSVFKFQLQYLAEHGYHFIPLARYVAYKEGKAPPPPPLSVVITMDDGHESVYTEALPLVEKYRIPVTLFIYPSAISNASYAMTWQQLRALKATGLFDIQSHTYWHPNFKIEKRRMTPAQYNKFVDLQLRHSRDVLDRKLGIQVSMLAWPFGIYDQKLTREASESGYLAAFALDGRHAGDADNIMEISRYLVTDRDSGRVFEDILKGTPARH
ncbi:MAG: polysaccharide deacetylase family protein [Acidobacteria bacterium]|nr:MAG: polysaccharide deacetylase family protein [Acidobacteriota bacterium]